MHAEPHPWFRLQYVRAVWLDAIAPCRWRELWILSAVDSTGQGGHQHQDHGGPLGSCVDGREARITNIHTRVSTFKKTSTFMLGHHINHSVIPFPRMALLLSSWLKRVNKSRCYRVCLSGPTRISWKSWRNNWSPVARASTSRTGYMHTNTHAYTMTDNPLPLGAVICVQIGDVAHPNRARHAPTVILLRPTLHCVHVCSLVKRCLSRPSQTKTTKRPSSWSRMAWTSRKKPRCCHAVMRACWRCCLLLHTCTRR